MNRFYARMFGVALFVCLFSAIAVQPAMGQQDQAKHVFHRGIPAGDTCATCHKAIYDQWKASPHSANGDRMHRVPWRASISGLCGHAGAKHLRQLSRRSGGTTEVGSIHEWQDVRELSPGAHLCGAQEGGTGRGVRAGRCVRARRLGNPLRREILKHGISGEKS